MPAWQSLPVFLVPNSPFSKAMRLCRIMDQDFMGYLKRHKMVLYTTEIDKDDEDNQMFYVIFAQAWALPQHVCS
jgi:hypothetical protein